MHHTTETRQVREEEQGMKEGSLEGRKVEIERKWEEERKSEMELLREVATEDVCHGISSESAGAGDNVELQWKTQ